MKRSLQRRKDRRALQEKRSLWAFQLLLLILIFFTWLIWAKIYFMFGVVTAHCVEQIAKFGEAEHLSHIYSLLTYSVSLMAIFWVVIAFSFPRGFRHWLSCVFHIVLLGSLVLLLLNFRLMRHPTSNPPDGTLAVAPRIMDTSFTPPKFVEYTDSIYIKRHWEFIESRKRPLREYNPSSKECIWLEQGIVTQRLFTEKPGYISATQEEKERLLAEHEFRIIDSDNVAFSDAFYLAVKSAFGEPSLMEQVRRKQIYRRLTAEERKRFEVKQNCLGETAYKTGHDQKCEFILIEEWDREIPGNAP